MGNKNTSNVSSGVKAQAAGEIKLYHLADLKGKGILVDLMKQANKTKNYTELDEKIQGLHKFLYNDGNCKWVHVRELVKVRGRDRGLDLGKKGEIEQLKDSMTAYDPEYLKQHGPQYKETCWSLLDRGAVGENLLHVCLLNASSIHADLAKRLLRQYPKLINDIYVSDEYYGENVLHMTIANEDPAMTKFFLDHGADYHQRCCGNFFSCDDQKNYRKDNLEHEWFDVPAQTNYKGYTYWGEYPLGFAACLGQEECVRLLIAKGADPNLQDTNGNTVLHVIVVHDVKMRQYNEFDPNYSHPEEMFDLLVSLGAKLHIKNRQGLTPLTLAAKLSLKEMYEHILELEREVYWIYGNVTCAGYPLEHIDTISETGEINTNSAMYHVVYGDAIEHLGMIDGAISHLLVQKWRTFAKYRFFRRFAMFALYFIIFTLAFYFHPGIDPNFTEVEGNYTLDNGTVVFTNITLRNPCYLLVYDTPEQHCRLVCEIITILGSVIYIFLSLKEIYHQGYRIFFQTLMSSPAKALFLLSNCCVILMVPGRAACAYMYEDIMGTLAILACAPYFLFFCRGFKIVGPFVVMIYTMIRTDLIRFFTIYLIFVIGFSQAFYVMFVGVEVRYFHSPLEGMLGLFVMSFGEFAEVYESFKDTVSDATCKVIFVVYMILVTLLLVNMLIAMMGNTYQMVNETQKEWLRQWAKIILVVEQTVTTDERRRQQIAYSQPLKDGRRALVIRWHQTEKEKEDLKKQKEDLKTKQKNMLQRKQDMRVLQNRVASVNVEQAKHGLINC